MKYILLLSFLLFNSLLYSQGIYFSEPLSTSVYETGQYGSAGIAYDYYHENGMVVYDYYAQIRYPDGHWSNWQHGETGGWWVTKAGTYEIQGKAWAATIEYPNPQWYYRWAFSFTVTDNYAPANPSNLSASLPNGNPPNYVHPFITWNANSEEDLSGYKVYREKDNEGWSLIATVTTNSYTDIDVIGPIQFSKFTYKVKAFDINNNYSGYSNEDYIYGYKIDKVNAGTGKENINQVPDEFSLLQNYPNPFNPTTEIQYGIKEDGFVVLKVYNMLGKEVANLVNEAKVAGYYTVQFNASNLPSGIYITSLRINDQFLNKKIMLLK
jgi:hypothetical protein